MKIGDIIAKTNMSRMGFAKKYGIPYRTICDWEYGNRIPPEYVLELLNFRVEHDMKEFERCEKKK